MQLGSQAAANAMDLPQVVLIATAAVLALALASLLIRERLRQNPLRLLLGRLATERSPVTLYIRGLFVPNKEFFSRAPEYPPGPAPGVTVHKWVNIPEVYGTSDVRAAVDLIQLLCTVNRELGVVFRSGEAGPKGWSEEAIAIGPHHKSLQILDTCEPRLVGFRSPAALRSLVTQEIFEAKGAMDYGLIYKGRHPSSQRAFWVVMGLGDIGTEAAAHFLRTNARLLGSLTGGAPFAAVVAVDTARGREFATLRLLQPRPRWWRRLLHRTAWQKVAGGATQKPS